MLSHSLFIRLYSASLLTSDKMKELIASRDLFLAFDCADISGISNAWIRRSGDNVVVKCNFTAETFFLTCRNSHWKGELFNCSDGRTAGPLSPTLNRVRSTLYYLLSVFSNQLCELLFKPFITCVIDASKTSRYL